MTANGDRTKSVLRPSPAFIPINIALLALQAVLLTYLAGGHREPVWSYRLLMLLPVAFGVYGVVFNLLYRATLPAPAPAPPVADSETPPATNANQSKVDDPLVVEKRLVWLWVGANLVAIALEVAFILLPILLPNQFGQEPDKNKPYDLVFAQITDPHMFDDGPESDKQGKTPMPRDERLNKSKTARSDDLKQFRWAIDQINEINLRNSTGQPIQFVTITGDFGLEAVDFAPAPQMGASLPSCNFQILPTPNGFSKSQTRSLSEAVNELAVELLRLKIGTVYVVPGNNDLAGESVSDQFRFQCFIALVEQKLQYPAGPHPVLIQLGTTPTIVHANGPNQTTYTLLGLNSASFKKKDPNAAAAKDNERTCQGPPSQSSDPQTIWNSCPEQQMKALLEWEANSPNSTALLFTHIPDLRDPFNVENKISGYQNPVWSMSDKAYLDWQRFARSPQVAAIFAGHFHWWDRGAYHPQPDDPANAPLWNKLSLDATISAKTWVTPPLADKFQTGLSQTARGFNIYRLRGRETPHVDRCWIGSPCSLAP